MALIYFSPIQYSVSAIMALSDVVKPYGQGIAIRSMPYTEEPVAYTYKRRLKAVSTVIPASLPGTKVSNLFKPPVVKTSSSFLVTDTTSSINLSVFDLSKKTVDVSKTLLQPKTLNVSLVAPDAFTPMGFTQYVTSLQVKDLTVRTLKPSTLLDIPQT